MTTNSTDRRQVKNHMGVGLILLLLYTILNASILAYELAFNIFSAMGVL